MPASSRPVLASFLALSAAACSPVGWLGVPGVPRDETGASDSGADTAPDSGDDTGDGTPWGTGADGDLDVTGRVSLTEHASGGRDAPDAVAFRVSALDASTATLTEPATGLAEGDEVLLLVAQGAASGWDAVGAFDLLRVEAVDGTLVTFDASPDPDLTAVDPASSVMVVQRVPQYGDVHVGDRGVLTVGAWSGGRGGVLAFRAATGVVVDEGGALAADRMGYAGGPTGQAYNCDGYQGESVSGVGGGGSCGHGYNGSTGDWAANAGGGGCHVTGGGGAHADGAADGASWDGGGALPPEAGAPYGEATLARLTFGSGGGGVWNGGGASGPGGAGGGIVWVATASLRIRGAGGLDASGESAVAWSQGNWTYGAGGGAGGSIRITASDVDLASGAVRARGGAGVSDVERPGGDGADGRIRVDCATCDGFAQGTPEAEAALADACDPDPAHSEAPR